MRPDRMRAAILRLGCILVVIATAALAVADEIPLSERRSGYELMSRDTKAMQDDDTANPAMLW
ncbi:MAG: sulfur oxidation c-type cytochrome SoxA, partial [Xanthobacteraceae bacterium]